MLRLLGRLDEALASANKALSIRPDIAEAWLVRATVMIMSGNVTDAQAGCQRALALKPDYAKALTLLGQCHLQQGNAEAALACFDRALAIVPDDETTLSNRIFALDFSSGSDFAVHQAARAEWWRRIGPTIPLPAARTISRPTATSTSASIRCRMAAASRSGSPCVWACRS